MDTHIENIEVVVYVMSIIGKIYAYSTPEKQHINTNMWVLLYEIMQLNLLNPSISSPDVNLSHLLKFCTNCVTKNPENAEIFLQKLLNSPSLLNLVTTGGPSNLSLLLIFLHNCLVDTAELALKLWQEAAGIKAFTQVFEAVHKAEESHKDTEGVKEWFARLLIVLLDKHDTCAPTLFNALVIDDHTEVEEVKREEGTSLKIAKYTHTTEGSDGKEFVVVTELYSRLMHYSCMLTHPTSEFKLTVKEILFGYLCNVFDELLKRYKEWYLEIDVLKGIYKDKESLLYHYHSNILETFESLVLIFNNITAEGPKTSSYSTDLFNHKALENVIELIKTIDDLSAHLIDLNVIPKNDSNEIPLMENIWGKRSTHPVAGLLTKCVRLIGNMLSQTRLAVNHFEQKMEHIGLILNHTKLDFVNVGIREHCMLCTKYMIDQSEIIRDNLKNITTLAVEDEGKELLKKVGLEEGYFMDKDKVDMVQSPFME